MPPWSANPQARPVRQRPQPDRRGEAAACSTGSTRTVPKAIRPTCRRRAQFAEGLEHPPTRSGGVDARAVHRAGRGGDRVSVFRGGPRLQGGSLGAGGGDSAGQPGRRSPLQRLSEAARLHGAGGDGNAWDRSFWRPWPRGRRPLVLPEGMAKRVPAGWRFVFVVHYVAVGSRSDRPNFAWPSSSPTRKPCARKWPPS